MEGNNLKENGVISWWSRGQDSVLPMVSKVWSVVRELDPRMQLRIHMSKLKILLAATKIDNLACHQRSSAAKINAFFF